MTTEDFRNDPYLQTITGLATYEPDRQRADRIRTRCHDRIRRQMRAAVLPRAAAPFCRLILEPSLVAVLCAVFLGEVLHRALLLYGF